MVSNMNFLFQRVIFRCHVSFREGKLQGEYLRSLASLAFKNVCLHWIGIGCPSTSINVHQYPNLIEVANASWVPRHAKTEEPWGVIHSLKLTYPLKIGLPNRKLVFQPSICRGYVSFREGIRDIHQKPAQLQDFLLHGSSDDVDVAVGNWKSRIDMDIYGTIEYIELLNWKVGRVIQFEFSDSQVPVTPTNFSLLDSVWLLFWAGSYPGCLQWNMLIKVIFIKVIRSLHFPLWYF